MAMIIMMMMMMVILTMIMTIKMMSKGNDGYCTASAICSLKPDLSRTSTS